jgi:ABC-type Fe3+/spermidine/putrescine transport system ATPase subunit
MSSAEFRDVSKHFGPVHAVDRVSFEIRKGEFFSLLGPSGCGKSTTLRLLAGLESPDAGAITIAGEPALAKPPYERGLGMVFQSYALFPHLSVERNVAYGLERHRVARSKIPGKVSRALELVRLPAAEFARRRPAELSGGQRQRVALARALVLEPELLLLDEPLGAIDPQLRKAMQLELRQLNRTLGITFVYVTHDQDEALTMSDRIAVMERGRIAQLGTPVELYERPRTRFVAGFIGEANLFPLEGKTVAVRPERIELLHGGGSADGGPVLAGTVDEVNYLGERSRIVIALADGSRVIATERNDGPLGRPLPWERGNPVLVRWRPESAHPLEDA